MPRLPEQNQAIKDRRRSKLLDAALKLFATKDYRDVTVDDITKASRCSHGLFYHYFPTMEAMFAILYREVIQPSKIDRWAEDSRALRGAEGLKRVCFNIEEGQLLEGKESNILLAVMRLFGAERGTDNAEFRERYDLRPTFLRLIREGQQEGKVIDGDPEKIERAFYALAGASIANNRQSKKKKEQPIDGETLYRFLLKN